MSKFSPNTRSNPPSSQRWR